MHVFKKAVDLQQFMATQTVQSGFVPTMGALHKGHLSLLQRAKSENPISICSVFVNPTQFNDPNDFANYPITLEADIELLESIGTDILFLPDTAEMYPNNEVESTTWDLGYLDTILDGLHRPGHFNGVCTIVDRLLRAVQPTRMYMGEKDFQQCLVIRRMLEITNSRVELITCPTLRELSGLAMSSRNERLSKSARERASAIYYCLKNIRTDMSKSTFPELQHRFIEYLRSNGFETEYLLLADANTLEIMENFDGSRQMVVLIACKFEGVRLIDNLRLS